MFFKCDTKNYAASFISTADRIIAPFESFYFHVNIKNIRVIQDNPFDCGLSQAQWHSDKAVSVAGRHGRWQAARATWRGCVNSARGFGLRFTARGSHRLGLDRTRF